MLTFLGQAEHGQDDCDKAYCDKSFDQTGDEAKVPARQFAGYKDAIKDYQDQPSGNNVCSEAAQTSSSEFDASVTKGTEIRQKQRAEFVTLSVNKAATELTKLPVNRLNGIYAHQVARGCAEG